MERLFTKENHQLFNLKTTDSQRSKRKNLPTEEDSWAKNSYCAGDLSFESYQKAKVSDYVAFGSENSLSGSSSSSKDFEVINKANERLKESYDKLQEDHSDLLQRYQDLLNKAKSHRPEASPRRKVNKENPLKVKTKHVRSGKLVGVKRHISKSPEEPKWVSSKKSFKKRTLCSCLLYTSDAADE